MFLILTKFSKLLIHTKYLNTYKIYKLFIYIFNTYKIYKIIIIQDLKKPLDLKKLSNSQTFIIRVSWAYLKNRGQTWSADKRCTQYRNGCNSYKLGSLSFGLKNRGQTRSTDDRGADNRRPTTL